MTRFLSWLALSLLVVALAAIALPRLYHMVFAPDVEPTHMFYSPVEADFVYREHRGHHDFTYASAGGKTFDRQGFEKTLPFIYYRNMDLWGLLPIEIDGIRYDKSSIRDARQVFELKSREITDRHPEIPVYALLDSDPGRAGLSFPEDVFRMTPHAMEFVNVDVNRVDPALTVAFTTALNDAGFTFPAGLVAGKQTILKPFDEGVFITDATGALFHVKRKGDEPFIMRTPVRQDIGVRALKVIENDAGRFLGLLLTRDNALYLLETKGYGLLPLPTDGYDPDRMDYKLIVNPVAPTAIYGNDEEVHAVAMTPDFKPFANYSRTVPGDAGTRQAWVAAALFPFHLDLQDHRAGYLRWHLTPGSWVSLIGTLLAVLVAAQFLRSSGVSRRDLIPPLLLVAFTGVFGLVSCLLVPVPRHRNGSG